MIYHIQIHPRTYHFRQPAGTSRGIYTTRKSWMLTITSPDEPGRCGVGECAPLPDLSCDAIPEYERTLESVCGMFILNGAINYDMMRPYPSMLFGLETALLSFERGSDVLFDTPFGRGEEGIPINGLVWMGSYDEMLSRLEAKLKAGFRCVKLKIGAIDFDKELDSKRLQIVDVNLDSDTLRWKSILRNDSASWRRYWAVGGVVNNYVRNLSISSTPYYILSDSTGNILYHGDNFAAARKLIENKLGKKQ